MFWFCMPHHGGWGVGGRLDPENGPQNPDQSTLLAERHFWLPPTTLTAAKTPFSGAFRIHHTTLTVCDKEKLISQLPMIPVFAHTPPGFPDNHARMGIARIARDGSKVWGQVAQVAGPEEARGAESGVATANLASRWMTVAAMVCCWKM